MSKRIFGVVTGMSGYGKSYFLMEYLIPELAKEKPVIVLDIHGEFEGRVFDGIVDFFDYCQKNEEIPGGVNVIRWKSETDIIHAISFVRALEAPVSLVIEESHILFTDTELKKSIKKNLKELTMFGRHFGTDIILCTQRPKNLTTNVRSQAQFVVSFRQEERADLEYLREKDSRAPEVVSNLEKHHYYSFGAEIPDNLTQIKANEVNKL